MINTKPLIPILFFSVLVLVCVSCTKQETTLKDAFNGYFLIGTSVSTNQIIGTDSMTRDIVIKEFNSVTAENAMKWERIHPMPGVYDFAGADSLVAFGQRNGMFIVGHTLVWHQQTPAWVFEDSLGNPVSRDTLLQRMKDHIYTVVGRYKGKVGGWDVVNEALLENGQMRNTKWQEIIGEDYIQKAFEYASEADPDAQLYYNDYNIEIRKKREGALKLIKHLLDKGVKIYGVGIQGHWHLDRPALATIDSSIIQFGETGLKVMFTEVDINVLPRPENLSGAELSQHFEMSKEMDPYTDGLPDSVQSELASRYADIFRIFEKHRDLVDRVTFWGVCDGYTWLNDWPIPGRTNYPLLFDRNYQPKKAYYAIIETVKK